MKDFIIYASSIFNIDFAAIPFSVREFGNINLSIMLNSEVKIARNSDNRKYESRLAIPMLRWEMDGNNDWRLIHCPIESVEKDFNKIIDEIQDSYLTVYGQEKFASIQSYFVNLISFCSASQNYIDLYKNLILYTVKSISGNITASIALLSELYDTENDKILLKILHCLNNIFDSIKDNEIYVFNCGGKIEFIGEYTFVIKKFRVINKSIVVVDDATILSTTSLCILFNSIECRKTNVKFYGMLELYYISYFGDALHLPSYCKTTDTFSLFQQNKFYEFITPMSCSDLSRTSYCNEGKKRLIPLGYSLLDIDFNLYKSAIQKIFKDDIIGDCIFNDWINLYQNYPRCDEKVAANQNPVKSYFESSHRKIKEKLTSGNYKSLSLLKLDEVSIYSFGEYLVQLYSLIRHIIESIHVRLKYEDDLKSYLQQSDYCILGDILNLFVDRSLKVLAKMVSHGLHEYIATPIVQSLVDLQKSYLQNGLSDIKYDHIKINELIISKAIPVIRAVSFQYYKYVAFINSTVLKSNIFMLSMLYKPDEFNALIDQINSMRLISKIELFPEFISQVS